MGEPAALCQARNIDDLPKLHDCYLANDVLVLADFLKNARRSFRQVLGLDIMRFLTMAKASWHAALYRSGR